MKRTIGTEVGRLQPYTLISRALDEAAHYAYHRAYKHLEAGQHPTEGEWAEHFEREAMNALSEIMEFPPYDEAEEP